MLLLASGTVIATLLLLLGLMLVGWARSGGAEAGTRTTVPRELGGARTVATSALAVGDCFDTSASEREDDGHRTVWSVMPQSCTVAHESEVIALVQVGDEVGPEYPGRQAIVGQAEPQCRVAHPQQVGVAAGPGTPLILHYVYPSPESWADGDRLVVCAVTSRDGALLVGTAREVVGADAAS